jgi:DNA-binding Lrp family transcriptional regulator
MDYKNLDYIDKQILSELYKDGTQNPNQLSNKIKKDDNSMMSHVAIQRRIKKLKGAKLLNIQGNIGMNRFNLKTAFFSVAFKNFNFSYEYLGKYAKCPRIFLSLRVSGDFHLILGIVGKDLEDLNNFINCCLLSDSDNIKSSSITFSSEMFKPSYIPINLFDVNIKKTKCGKNCEECESYKKEICLGCVFL